MPLDTTNYRPHGLKEKATADKKEKVNLMILRNPY